MPCQRKRSPLPASSLCRRRSLSLSLPSPSSPQDRPLALRLLDEAGQRLQRAIEFLRGSEEPFLALGDVLLERGEQQAAGGDAAAAAASLQAALDEGYGRVARIKANHPEAAVGAGDVHVQLARLAAGSGGGGEAAAAQHWAAAEAHYRAALQGGGAALGGLRERCDVRYNHACCLARCGRADEAAAILRSLLALGGTTAADVQADADLSGLPL